MSDLGKVPPRVLFVNQSSEIGGGELALLDFVSQLPHAHVALFAPGPFLDRLHAAGVSASIIDAGAVLNVRRDDGMIAAARSSLALAQLCFRLARLAKRYDVVYANSQKAFIAAAPAAWIARRPLVWHLHDILSADHFSSGMKRIGITLANRFARHVITNSHASAEAFTREGGKTPILVSHNGIDPRPFGNGRDAEGHARLAAMIGSGDAPVIGTFSRLAVWKGQETVLRALRGLADHHLVLVGGALFGEQGYEGHLRRLVVEWGLAGRVHFLGFREDVPDLMRSVDVVVHSSISPEPFGRVIVEGMLAGVPVVATAAGGALEIIEDGRTGLLFTPGDVTALADHLNWLHQNPETARTIADTGRQHALCNFGLQTANDRQHELLIRVAQSAGNQ